MAIQTCPADPKEALVKLFSHTLGIDIRQDDGRVIPAELQHRPGEGSARWLEQPFSRH